MKSMYVSFICGLSLFIGIHFASTETVYIQSAKHFETGFSSVSPNIYHVWVNALDSERFEVHTAGQVLSVPISEKESHQYSWKNIGKIKVEERSNLTIQINQTEKENPLAYVALAADETWNPQVWMQNTHVLNDPAQHAQDKRTGVIRSTRDHYYHFPSYESKREWLERKMELRDHINVSMGAQPMPEKTPLRAKVFDKMERDGYSVEKVYFESYPGYFVTGNLYRPTGKEGPFPGILSPHGHWSDGRLADNETGSVPGRCINLARQGHVVFTYDMVGYVDSKQLGHDFSSEREWLWGITLHGIQFWNGIRGVDFLLSLDDVDPERIGCTGASGGGTQTYFLTAVDDRVKVSAPVNMISSHFQGGCLCENAANLRIDANNVEYGAMMAPRPLLIVANTSDWTTETPWVEYPAVQSVYQIMDAKSNVRMVQMDAPHNFNKDSREAVYAWFGKWFLENENTEDFAEQPFDAEEESDLRVFPGELPDHAASEEELVRYLMRQSEEQLKARYPDTKRGLQNLRYDYLPALQHVLGVKFPDPDTLQVDRIAQIKHNDHFAIQLMLGRKGAGDQIPGILLIPRSDEGVNQGSLLLHEDGKAGWIDLETGKPNAFVQSLLEEGSMVFMPDVFMTGEYHSAFSSTQREQEIRHFYTYNQSNTALRVQDILTAAAFLQSHHTVEKTIVAAEGDAGLWAVLAASMMENIDAIVVDAAQFATSRDSAYMEQLYVPGLRRAGDFRSAQALIAPIPLFVHNTDRVFHTAWAKDAYQTLHAEDQLVVKENKATHEEILRWLSSQN